MSSEIPEKPSTGGNKVLIALTLVMLSATAGLLVWKFAGSSGPEPAATTDTASTVETRPEVNLTPPPPPPPPPTQEPSAAPSAQNPNGPVRSGKPACSGTCTGDATGALKSALAGRGGAGRRCYEKALSQNQGLRGRMTVHVRVGTNGSVCAANVTHDELHDPGLSNCILGVFRASVLPEPDKGCVEIDVPLNFVPNK